MCPGTDLFTDLEENEFMYDESKASIIIRQILEAVAYCHDQGFVHRDIKPDNIMIDVDSEDAIKLIDFGLSHEISLHQPKSSHVLGTAGYMAPEVINGKYD